MLNSIYFSYNVGRGIGLLIKVVVLQARILYIEKPM